MGCISSKLAAADRNQERKNMVICSIVRDCPNHVVSLTSSTYGALKLDREKGEEVVVLPEPKRSPLLKLAPFRKSVSKEDPEIINAWELMGDLDDDIPIYSPVKKPAEVVPVCSAVKKTASPNVLQHSPKEIKPVESTMSPRKPWKLVGKENLQMEGLEVSIPDANRCLKPFNSIENVQILGSPASAVRYKRMSPMNLKIQVSGKDPGLLSVSRRRSLSPFFDPELVASFEKELCQEKEQIKMMVSVSPRNRRAQDLALLLESFEKKCPPGGQNTVVLYTTTLRGIRKTFEDCNATRSTIESYGVQVLERDISMDSGFREELRVLMGKKEVRVPVVFVKGRLIGGADEVLKLEEEGKLELLLDGVPRAAAWCDGCGGMRFVMCMECNGSRKVLDEEQQKVVKCEECNENGLIHCPICC